MLDALRGILITAIVCRHSRLVSGIIPGYFSFFYFWHVQGFFLLAYARSGSLADVRIADRLVRYLTPYLWFAVSCALVRLAVGSHGTSDLARALGDLLIGTAHRLDRSAGLQVFWFLPCFAGFTTALILFDRARRRWAWANWVIAPGVLAWAGGALLLPHGLLDSLPLGLGLVGYLLVLAEGHTRLLALTDGVLGRGGAVLGWAITAGLLVAEAVIIARGGVVNIAIYLFSLPASLPVMLLNSGAASAANVVVWHVARRLQGVGLLRTLGARSMDIFLIHQFVLHPFTLAVQRHWPQLTLGSRVVLAACSVVLALTIALALSRLADWPPLVRPVIFPKGLPRRRPQAA